MKDILKLFFPPVLLMAYRKFFQSKYGWKGNYSSWASAQQDSVGYDDQEILNKVKSSLLKVKLGEAVYERDGVIFDEIQYSWPLLSGLMYAAAGSNGELNVLDFGGSLGSTYYQNKKFLDGLESVSWSIVEQPNFVSEGNRCFESEVLKFYANIEECLQAKKPNVLLLSSVLQYLESPYAVLEVLCKYNFEIIIVDRNPFTVNSMNRVVLQLVTPDIYDASYPCRFMSETQLIEFFESRGFETLVQFPALDGVYEDFYFGGMIMQNIKRDNSIAGDS